MRLNIWGKLPNKFRIFCILVFYLQTSGLKYNITYCLCEVWCRTLKGYKQDRGKLLTLWTLSIVQFCYLKQCFGDRTLPPSSGNRPTQLGPIHRASPYLRTPELTQIFALTHSNGFSCVWFIYPALC
jgi:hypothetical protein